MALLTSDGVDGLTGRGGGGYQIHEFVLAQGHGELALKARIADIATEDDAVPASAGSEAGLVYPRGDDASSFGQLSSIGRPTSLARSILSA